MKLVDWLPVNLKSPLEVILWKLYSRKKRIRVWFRYHVRFIKVTKGRHLWNLLIRECPRCSFIGDVHLQHQNCAYVDELSNYYWCCSDCHQEIHDMYQERWDEYNAGRL